DWKPRISTSLLAASDGVTVTTMAMSAMMSVRSVCVISGVLIQCDIEHVFKCVGQAKKVNVVAGQLVETLGLATCHVLNGNRVRIVMDDDIRLAHHPRRRVRSIWLTDDKR